MQQLTALVQEWWVLVAIGLAFLADPSRFKEMLSKVGVFKAPTKPDALALLAEIARENKRNRWQLDDELVEIYRKINAAEDPPKK